ncbi:MAG: DUF1292 domain-containing protein [Clostridiales bacterium]|jgi:hypothetical protein|nr:DUF1292 domain-containing protein [Clostridiales bacterium]
MNDEPSASSESFREPEDSYKYKAEDSCVTMYDEDDNQTEFIVISSVRGERANYLLVAESARDPDESEALILKEIRQDDDNMFFKTVDDDAEFMEAVSLFQLNDSDYELDI